MDICITVSQKGLRQDGIEALIRDQVRKKYPAASISVAKIERPTSRAERFAAATAKINEASSEVQELYAELESWKDNLPENVQDGNKAQQLEEAMDALEEMHGQLEEAEGTTVDFPDMMG